MINTYGEKTLHRELKWRLEPRSAFHEVPVGKYIADIKNDDGIIEIQTRSLFKLRGKLSAFLPDYSVTLVYPVACETLIHTVDRDSGEIIRTRKSPRRGSVYGVFAEIYQLKSLLTHQNLKLRIILADVSERRYKCENRRKGYQRIDKEINALRGEVMIDGAADYARLIPPALDGRFTSSDFSAASGLNASDSAIALNVLHYVQAVRRVGKSGRFYLYEKEYN